MSYFGATDTPVLDFWWRLLWVPPLVLHVANLLKVSIAGHQDITGTSESQTRDQEIMSSTH